MSLPLEYRESPDKFYIRGPGNEVCALGRVLYRAGKRPRGLERMWVTCEEATTVLREQAVTWAARC